MSAFFFFYMYLRICDFIMGFYACILNASYYYYMYVSCIIIIVKILTIKILFRRIVILYSVSRRTNTFCVLHYTLPMFVSTDV